MPCHRLAAWAAGLMLVSAAPGPAHEFWIEPEAGVIEPGEAIVAGLKVGTMLKGEPYPYLSNRFVRFEVIQAGRAEPVSGTEGDLPALSQPAPGAGLTAIVQQTVAFRVTHDDPALFRQYLVDEGLDGILEHHRARGLPETGFAERYTRYAKALVQVGPVAPGATDRSNGMPFEIVAGANPYAEGQAVLPVTLLWQGAPLAHWQISVFRDNGDVTRTPVRTDAEGRVELPLGSGRYLLNAVLMEPADDDPVVWSSHWASLSFDLPNVVER